MHHRKIDWIADGHEIRIRVDGGVVLITINGVTAQCSLDDANALLSLLEALESGGMD